MKRLEREIRTVGIMIAMYCRDRHGAKVLCVNCRDLAAYAEQRVRKCPFGENKPACGSCPIHCYKPRMKEQIKEVMRHAGPRMIFRHPILAICHLAAARKKQAIDRA